MRRLWILVAALVAFGGLAAFSPAAGAASAPSPKFCAAVAKIGTGGSDGSSPSPQEAAQYAPQFKNAGKYAPANVKAAASRISSVLSKLKNISAKNASDLAKFYTTSDFKAYGKAVVTFFTYSSQCGTTDTTTTTSG